MTATEPLPPMAAGPAETFGVTVRSRFEPGDVMNEPAEHHATVFPVPPGVEDVLVPDVVQILRGWDKLFARMKIEERQVFAVLLDQSIRVFGGPPLLLEQPFTGRGEIEVLNGRRYDERVVHEHSPAETILLGGHRCASSPGAQRPKSKVQRLSTLPPLVRLERHERVFHPERHDAVVVTDLRNLAPHEPVTKPAQLEPIQVVDELVNELGTCGRGRLDPMRPELLEHVRAVSVARQRRSASSARASPDSIRGVDPITARARS